MSDFPKSDRNRVRRLPDRGRYDKATIYPIVDAALLCHVGMVDAGQPIVIPTLHARRDDEILLHGASTSRLLRYAASGAPLCITVSHVDGLVLARSVFHHSVNYRSAVLFGQGRLIEEAEEKMEALAAFTEKLIPGRWDDARKPNAVELKATSVVAVTIESASAKIRTGPPKDDEEDYALDVWAGVLPIQQYVGELQADPAARQEAPVPDYLRNFRF
ncbi:MAG TPA: pyridoxamine 5'-phosphate oxidase family protein [Caldilineaceae bacterium]|nr:pyridoxamine 5'-phosphate oxidase family protein [Caldilineaceae bacterium]